MADLVDCALDLLRRLVPNQVEENLNGILTLNPDLTDELTSCVDQPLKVYQCPTSGRDFLICDYNKDGESYRSPWSNDYIPALQEGALPSEKLRKLEEAANDAFHTYRELYYGGGVSSVYMWDLEDGFAAVVLLKKVNDTGVETKGQWDAIHVVEVNEKNKSANYRITSTVMLRISHSSVGDMSLSGSLTRQHEQEMPIEVNGQNHIINLGKLVEDMEMKLRNSLQEVYFGKTKDIVNDLRSINSLQEIKKQAAIHAELVGKMYQK